MHVLGLSGSLRKNSWNTALLRAAAKQLPAGISMTFGSIELPLFNADLEAESIESVTLLRQQVMDAGAVLIVCPEYNYGIPGGLKNAIDWASRPAFRSPFADRPVGIMGAAPGATGTARAQGQLKQVLLGMAAQVFPYPEFLVGQCAGKFDDGLELSDQNTIEHLQKYLAKFVGWAQQVS